MLDNYNIKYRRRRGRGYWSRRIFIVLLIFFFISALLGRWGQERPRIFSQIFSFISTPIITTSYWFHNGITNIINKVGTFFLLQEKMHKLTQENRSLRFKLLSLQKQLNYYKWVQDFLLESNKAVDKYDVVQVIGTGDSNWLNTLIINAGSRNGLAPSMSVLDKSGLLGIVERVMPRAARILLLNDPNLTVAIKTETDDFFGLLQGTGKMSKDCLRLKVERSQNLAPGTKLVTSGWEGLYFPGIPVGKISNRKPYNEDLFKVYTVIPYADLKHPEFVMVIPVRNPEATRLKKEP